MTTLEIVYYVVLPAAFVLVGWIAVRINERDNRTHPGE